jgi:hypothetical protein
METTELCMVCILCTTFVWPERTATVIMLYSLCLYFRLKSRKDFKKLLSLYVCFVYLEVLYQLECLLIGFCPLLYGGLLLYFQLCHSVGGRESNLCGRQAGALTT